jgi:hypothetical protein
LNQISRPTCFADHIGEWVTYIPDHALGVANHPDAEMGFITSVNENWVFVRFSGGTSQACNPVNLFLQ